MQSPHPYADEEEPAPGAFRTAFQRVGSAPSAEVVALLAQVDRLRGIPDVAVPARPDTIRDGADPAPSAETEAGPAAEVGRRISWQRALALLGLGCLTLGAALACIVFAAGFYVAALIEPHDVLLAAREALYGTLLLGGGVSIGLTWALVAAVGYATRTVVPDRRAALAHAHVGAPRVVLG